MFVFILNIIIYRCNAGFGESTVATAVCAACALRCSTCSTVDVCTACTTVATPNRVPFAAGANACSYLY